MRQYVKSSCFFALISIFAINIVFGQNTSIADSVKKILLTEKDRRSDYDLLRLLTANESNPDSTLKYAEILIRHPVAESNNALMADAYMNKAFALRMKGEYNAALEAGFASMNFAVESDSLNLIARINIVLANIYSENNDNTNAAIYFNKGIANLRHTRDSLSLAKALFNAGDNYLSIGSLDSALVLTLESKNLFKLLGSEFESYCLGNLGYIYFKLDNDSLAVLSIEQAIDKLEDQGDQYAISEYQLYIAEINISNEEYEEAIEHASQALLLAKQNGLREVSSEAYRILARVTELQNDHESSLRYFKDHIALEDSIHNLESVKDMANLRTNFEISQKQLEVDLLNQQKRTQRIILYSLGLGLVLIFIFYRKISREKNRSEMLLLNILPTKTANELKEKGSVTAKKFEAVTVMFTDFESFTKHSYDLTPEKLVKSVDYFFSGFDRIIEKHGLEKIKTIGDAYMCTGGLAKKGSDQPVKVLNAAFEILSFVEETYNSANPSIAHFRIRIGINTGPVVGGVVGTKKFAYDIWGDTVNVAARMESNSEPCKINISENTYLLTKDKFECEYRGEIDVKNKGMMKMYFVNSIRSHVPNQRPAPLIKPVNTEAQTMRKN